MGKKLKLNIPKGTELCVHCQGIGCKSCDGKGYIKPLKATSDKG